MNQSIIVYRNPLEQMFWESFMNSPYVWPILCAVVVFLLVAWAVASFLENPPRWTVKIFPGFLRSWRYDGYFALVVAASSAVVVFTYLVH